MSLSAFLGAFCFCVLLHTQKILDFQNPNLTITVVAILLIASAFLLKLKTESHLRLTFSLAGMTMGKVLLVIGILLHLGSPGLSSDLFLDAMHWHWSMTTALVVCGITFVLYPLYRLPADEFLWSFLIFSGLLFQLCWINNFLTFYLLFGVLLILGGLLLQKKRPLSYAAILSVVVATFALSMLSEDLRVYLAMLLCLALFGFLGCASSKLKPRTRNYFLLGGVLFSLSPEVMVSLGVLVLGYSQKDKFLLILGRIALPIGIACMLWEFYWCAVRYNVPEMLMLKGALFVAGTVIFFTGRALMKSPKKILFLLSCVLVFGALNYSIYEKEHLKKTGKTIFVKLEAFNGYLIKETSIKLPASMIKASNKKDIPDIILRGHALAGLWSSSQLHRGGALNPHKNTIQIVPDAFSFPKGCGQANDPAKYAILKIDNRGNCLLVGVADEKSQEIPPT